MYRNGLPNVSRIMLDSDYLLNSACESPQKAMTTTTPQLDIPLKAILLLAGRCYRSSTAQFGLYVIAGTSSGKTMSFWMPLLLDEAKEKMVVVISPLNELEAEQVSISIFGAILHCLPLIG